MRVLHVTDAWASGVATAIEGWVRADGADEHVLLVRERHGIHTPHLAGVPVHHLPPGAWAAARCLRRMVRELAPDVVHAHSSRAGALARVLPLGCRVVYTPHAYAFQRTDVGRATAWSFRAVERLLARRCITAACGEHEAGLARRIGPAGRVVVLPYVVPGIGARSAPAPGQVPTVVMMGRLAPQKGFQFAVEVAAVVRRARPDAGFFWVGDDTNAEWAGQVRAAGMELTGWLARDEALSRLATAHVYLHTAAWEGLPLTVLEALALGVPVVARRLPPLDELGVPQGDSPQAVAELVLALLTPAGRAAGLQAAATALAGRPSVDEVAARLVRLYAS